MNPNLHYTTATAAQPLDPEKAAQSHATAALMPPVGPPSYYAVYEPPVPIPQDGHRNVRRRRFWHFTACAVFLLLFWRPLVFGTARIIASLTADRYSPPMYNPPRPDRYECNTELDWTLEPGRSHGQWPLHAHTSLKLPVDAAELLFRADGSLVHGVFEISQSADVGNDAVVDVNVDYRSEDALSEVKVCGLHPAEDKYGLGIFSPHWHRTEPEYRMRFNVHVRLPATEHGGALTINDLNTYLPNFAQHLADLADSVLFKSIRLTTTNGALVADSVNANVAAFHLTNGAVRGTFNTSDNLDITTSNGAIDIHANLLNKDEKQGTIASLVTTNGAIRANVGLFTDGGRDGGAFRVNARTTNGASTLTFVDAPANSLLNASAVTTNGPVHVAAHPAFEGTFELHSAWFSPPVVQHDRPVEDPLGRGRRRNVQLKNVNKLAIRGEVGWEPKHEKAKSGHINLETTNARSVLIL